MSRVACCDFLRPRPNTQGWNTGSAQAFRICYLLPWWYMLRYMHECNMSNNEYCRLSSSAARQTNLDTRRQWGQGQSSEAFTNGVGASQWRIDNWKRKMANWKWILWSTAEKIWQMKFGQVKSKVVKCKLKWFPYPPLKLQLTLENCSDHYYVTSVVWTFGLSRSLAAGIARMKLWKMTCH